MYKLIIALLFSLSVSLTANATEIHWAKDFKSGIMQAKIENKPVLFVYSRHSCKYCVMLEETTFKDKKVIESLNKDFISIVAYSDENDAMPRELYRPGTPTIWFLMPNGVPMYEQDRNFPVMGAINQEYFMQLLGIVKTDFEKRNSKKRVKK